jgi:hypothetical protein
MAVKIDALGQLPEFGDFLGDFTGHQVTGQARLGADAHDDFQGIRGFDIAERKSHAARQNLNHLLVGIVPFFGKQAAFPIVDGGSNNISGFGQGGFGFFAQGPVRHAGNQNRCFNDQWFFGKAGA